MESEHYANASFVPTVSVQKKKKNLPYSRHSYYIQSVSMTSSNATHFSSPFKQHIQSISQPVSNKLEGHNYLTWSVQFQVFL
jgi:hypothetical protein